MLPKQIEDILDSMKPLMLQCDQIAEEIEALKPTADKAIADGMLAMINGDKATFDASNKTLDEIIQKLKPLKERYDGVHQQLRDLQIQGINEIAKIDPQFATQMALEFNLPIPHGNGIMLSASDEKKIGIA